MSGARARAGVSAADLAEAMRPLASSSPAFLKYDESNKCTEAKTDPQLIKAAEPLIDALRKLSPKLAFKRSVVCAAFRVLVEENQTKWGLQAKYVADWVGTHTNRLMNLCHVVHQNMSRKNPPAWVKQLNIYRHHVADTCDEAPAVGDDNGDNDDAECEGEGAGEENGEEEDGEGDDEDMEDDQGGELEATYAYGFSKELKLAWGQNSETRRPRKEMAMPFDVASLPDDGLPTAVWTDGHTKVLSQITVAEFKKLTASRATTRSESIWTGEHSKTHHKLTVKRRPDRDMLVVLCEQQKMVCGIRAKHFAKEGDTDQEPAIAEAAKLIITIAERFMKDEIKANQFYKCRDELCDSMGINARGKEKTAGPRKRPAAAVVEEESHTKPPKTTKSKAAVAPKKVKEEVELEDDDVDDGIDKSDSESSQHDKVARKRPAVASSSEVVAGTDLLRFLSAGPTFRDGLCDLDVMSKLSGS